MDRELLQRVLERPVASRHLTSARLRGWRRSAAVGPRLPRRRALPRQDRRRYLVRRYQRRRSQETGGLWGWGIPRIARRCRFARPAARRRLFLRTAAGLLSTVGRRLEPACG